MFLIKSICYLSVYSDVFNEFKKLVEIVIEKINEIRGKEYEIKSDYLKIREEMRCYRRDAYRCFYEN